jgi:hypothetical protein
MDLRSQSRRQDRLPSEDTIHALSVRTRRCRCRDRGGACADLDHMAKMGINSVRVAVFWAGYEPEEGQHSEEFVTAFRAFVEEWSTP